MKKQKTKKYSPPKKFIGTNIQEEVKTHFPIKISFWKSLKLFVMNNICCIPLLKSVEDTYLLKLFAEG